MATSISFGSPHGLAGFAGHMGGTGLVQAKGKKAGGGAFKMLRISKRLPQEIKQMARAGIDVQTLSRMYGLAASTIAAIAGVWGR
jgi:hypothetical protein